MKKVVAQRKATKLKDYVRHGQQTAVIELELQAEEGQTVTIKRTLNVQNSKNGGGNEWHMDGVKVLEQAVRDLVAKLEINLENLCNFLPQERVSSFARVTATERLVETMRTVGGREMVNQFEQLCSFRQQEKQLAEVLQRDSTEMQEAMKRNQQLETDVQRYREHAQIVRNIEMLEKKRPWIEYNHSRDEWVQAKQKRKDLQATVKDLEEQNRPLVDRIRQLEEDADDALQQQKDCATELKHINKVTMDVNKKIQLAENLVEKAQNSFTDLDNKAKSTATHIRRLIKEIKMQEDQIKDFKQPVEDSVLAMEKKGLEKDRRLLQQQLNPFEEVVEAIQSERNSYTAQLKYSQDKMKNLTDIQLQRLVNVSNWNRDAYNAAMWIKDNKERFKMKVHGPIAVAVNLKDNNYADIIENAIGNAKSYFVCECKADYETLMSECSDKQHLYISVVENSDKTSDHFKPPFPVEQLRQLGFDCFAIDLVQAPDAVLMALCDQTQLHRVPVSLKQFTVDSIGIVELGVRSFYQGRQCTQGKKSKYGNKQVSLQQFQIGPSRNFNIQAVDPAELASIQTKIHELEIMLLQSGPKLQDAQNELQKYKDKIAAVEKDISKLQRKRQAASASRQDFDAIVKKVNDKKFNLKELQDAPSFEEKRQQLENELSQFVSDKVKAVQSISDVVKSLQVNADTNAQACLRLVQARLTKAHLEQELSVSNRDLVDAVVALKEVTQQIATLKLEATRLLEKARQSGDPSEAEQLAFAKLPEDLNELDALLASENARAAMNVDTDPELIRQYENREQRIKMLQKSVNQSQQALDALRGSIDEIKHMWESAVNDCVTGISQRFAENFAKLGCTGAVELRRHDDYDQWGLDILIRFRDGEELCVLDGHRQSGGERSVTIMMYLMALQSFSRTPFRVVDEINQGMDPRNERLVHAQLVDTVCERYRGQYFLITPKLLPDLHYHQNMTINVVYNGEFLPDRNQWKRGCVL